MIFSIFVISFFLFLSLTRSYPHPDFETIARSTGDDWNTYARYALDIKHNGILMPLERRAFYCPGSFLYSYFLALSLVIFGVKSLPIFVMQHLMLGISVTIVYWTFRNKMRDLTSMLFFISMLVFAFKDVYKNYSPLLLSENLAIFLLSLFFLCFIKGFEKDIFPLQIASACLLGLSILTRPNIVFFGIVLIPIVAVHYIRKKKNFMMKILLFTIVLFASSSLLMVRNYLVCGKLYFLPEQVSTISFVKLCHPVPASVDISRVDSNFLYAKLRISHDIVSYAEYAIQQPAVFFGYYFKKVVFCLGYLPALSSAYELRLRWVLMWIGYFVYLILRVRKRERFDTWETAMHCFIFTFYASLILSGPVESYGFRMLIPGLNFVLAFSFMALDRISSKSALNHNGDPDTRAK